MKDHYSNEALISSRFAPYVLVPILSALVLSLVWIGPRWSYVAVGLGLGGLLFCCHVLKWRKRHEGYQMLAIATWVIPMFVTMAAESRKRVGFFNSGAAWQALFAYVLAYSGLLTLFRARIMVWFSGREERS